MAGTTVFDLPTELLQKIFDCVDWDRSKHLTPTRPDILNISLTCDHLRKAVVPILFRNVSLKLRWVNGALAEPALLRLRQQCPHLAQYTRCIYIETMFGHFKDSRSRMKPFAVPAELQKWLDSTGTSSNYTENHIAEMLLETPQCSGLLADATQDVQDRFQSLAPSLASQIVAAPWRSRGVRHGFDDPDNRDHLGDESFVDDARVDAVLAPSTAASGTKLHQRRGMRFQLDALFVLMLCFPPRLTSLVFESLPTDRMDTLQNQFSLYIAALAFRVYGGELKTLTIMTSALRSSMRVTEAARTFETESAIFSEVLSNLNAVQALTLGSHAESKGSDRSIVSLKHWHMIADRITSLDLRYVAGDQEGFIDFIEKFTNLEHLTLGQIDLRTNPTLLRHNGQSPGGPWLSFMIELRRRLPDVEFSVHELEIGSGLSLPASGTRWILQEAVPKGSVLDFERETRLVEDFESFIILWRAEDGERGDNAREDRKDGRLVDLAMSSRWRGFKYVSD